MTWTRSSSSGTTTFMRYPRLVIRLLLVLIEERMGSRGKPMPCFLVLAFAVTYLGLAISGVDAATCVGGKPTFGEMAAPQVDCHCFDKDPPGTRIFALYGVVLNVMTSGGTHGMRQGFGAQFNGTPRLTCDSEHLFVSDEMTGRHVYPLRETTIARGPIGEMSVFPGERPDSYLQHLINIGRARFQRTLGAHRPMPMTDASPVPQS